MEKLQQHPPISLWALKETVLIGFKSMHIYIYNKFTTLVGLFLSHSVANDHVNGHLSLILGNYALQNLPRMLKFHILKPSFTSKVTKRGLN